MPPPACPACRKIALNLLRDTETGLEIDTCPRCHGLWFDGQELSRFVAGGSLKKEFMAVAEVEPIETVGFAIGARQRRCPRCRQPMEERMFADVAIDICDRCEGIWMDDGELQRIMAKYEKGAKGDPLVRRELERGFTLAGNRPEGFLALLLRFLKKMRGD